MTEKDAISEDIKEKINKINVGNQYIISEFEKLKVAVEKLQVNLPNIFDPNKWLTEMKNKFEGLADLAELGKIVKDLKPTIDGLKSIMSFVGEMKETLDDIKGSTIALGDLKTLSTELKMAMAEIREISKTKKIAAPVAPVDIPKAKPFVKPIPSSISTKPKDISSKPLSEGPLKAGITYKRKKLESTTIRPPIVKPIKSEPVKINPITTKPAKIEPIIIKPAIIKSIKVKPAEVRPITEKSKTEKPTKKKGKTPPIVIEVFRLIEQRAKGGESANALSKIIENARDTIAKSWQWHPILLEVGTFARKLKKMAPEKPPDADVITLLLEKIEHWKEKMS